MKYLILVLFLLASGCGTTLSGGKTKTLNTSNLVKGSSGIYRMPTAAKKEVKGEEVSALGSKKEIVKINWPSLLFFYFTIAWMGVMSWMAWKILKEYKKKETNPFKVKIEENSEKP